MKHPDTITYPPKAPKVAFSNSTMRQPVKGKPHIALIDGYWRVSPRPIGLHGKSAIVWTTAYHYVGIKNYFERYSKCT